MAFAGLRTNCATCCDDDCIICITGFNGDPYQCPYTVVSGYWLEADSELQGTGPGLVTFDEAPTLSTDPVKVSVNALSANAYQGTFWLLSGWIDENTYVFGELSIETGIVTMRVGQNGSYLTEALDIGDFLNYPVDVELCWRPPVIQETTEAVLSGADEANGAPEWEVATGPVENILTYDDGTYCSRGSLGEDEISGPIGVEWYPFLPEGATIDEIRMLVRCREAAEPGNGIEDNSATVTAGGVALSDKATSTAIPALAVGFGELVYSWTGAELSAVTWENINDQGITCGIRFYMPSGTGGGTQPDVEAIRLVVFFTTRADIPGRLTMTLTPEGGGPVHCSTAFDVDGVSGKAGLRIIEGDWTFDTFRHEYMASGPHAGCATCDCGFTPHPNPSQCLCCNDYSGIYAQILLNIAGGWTADLCSGCPEVTGTYELTATRVGCSWQYQEAVTCGVSDCSSTGLGLLIIAVYIEADPDDGLCRWTADITFTSTAIADPSDPTGSFCYAKAVYRSDPISGDCETFPVTLDLVSDDPGSMCNGAMPATLTLDAPV